MIHYEGDATDFVQRWNNPYLCRFAKGFTSCGRCTSNPNNLTTNIEAVNCPDCINKQKQ